MKLHDSTDASLAPVLKIGAVVVRSVTRRPSLVVSDDASGAVAPSPLAGEGWGEGASSDTHLTHAPPSNLPPQGGKALLVAPPLPGTRHQAPGTSCDILIIRPKPKTAGEVPPFVLPRGSRQYQDADGVWHDARDEATGARHADRLEPYERSLAREVEEEAGVTSAMLARAQVEELGAMAFTSRTKGTYPIHWFMVMPAPADAVMLGHELPKDAMEMKWASLDDIKAMAATGEFSAGYVPVIEAALARANGAA